jgi:GTP-binding protein EngB required for normal cell division
MNKGMDTVNNLINWLSNDETSNTIKNLSDNQILNIANDINSLFSETNLIENKPELSLPKLVVVGTQSSGKSSVLNAIIAMDILPTGKNMVTRTPLDIRLHKIESSYKDGWVEFGSNSVDNIWVLEAKIPITVPTPTTEEVGKIREFIKKKTIELAGNGMNISLHPIILDIYSPYVPNLSLTDLPGLTMVACTDKGQPEDIKEKIEEMVSAYIKQKRTIILAVMQSRSDLETDLGLALIKKHDAKGQRTIGVLTKPDLMNSENHIGDYLSNSISKNLMLTYGYYVVRNRSESQMKDMDPFKGFDMEKEYFNNHKEYKRSIYQSRTGMKNLTIDLNKILVSSITEMLPSVMTEIVALEAKINKKLETMGDSLPETKEGKVSVLNKYVSNFNTRFLDSIESRGTVTILNTGKKIKDVFVDYRQVLENIKPFTNHDDSSNNYTENYFVEVVSSFEGNHMSFHIPPVQVLEACMMDEKLRPIMKLKDPSLICVDQICDAIINLIRDITKLEEFAQYPPLASYILNITVDNIISDLKIKAKKQVNDVLLSEESYIWTDDKEFAIVLSKTSTNNGFDLDEIKNMLESYFTSIKHVISHGIPKIIMRKIIREVETSLLTYLIQNVVNEDKICLLKENDDIEKQRTYYYNMRSKINGVKKSFLSNI